MTKTEMRTERVGRDLFVVVHTSGAPSDVEWERYVASVSDAGLAPVRGIFVVTSGGAPNAAQRKRLVEGLEKRGSRPRVAVLSPSALVRTIVAAFNLFFPQPMKMFAPRDFDPAFDYLGVVVGGERAAVMATAVRLGKELAVNVDALAAVS